MLAPLTGSYTLHHSLLLISFLLFLLLFFPFLSLHSLSHFPSSFPPSFILSFPLSSSFFLFSNTLLLYVVGSSLFISPSQIRQQCQRVSKGHKPLRRQFQRRISALLLHVTNHLYSKRLLTVIG